MSGFSVENVTMLTRKWRLSVPLDKEAVALFVGLGILSFLVSASLFFLGCRKESVELQRELLDATGSNKLTLYDLVERSSLSSSAGHYFHSLVWREQVGTNWTNRRVIDQATFQLRSLRRHWIYEIVSFDALSGIALIKVGQELPPVTTSSGVVVNVEYSWREWSLLTNREIRVLKVCKDPFEKYIPSD